MQGFYYLQTAIKPLQIIIKLITMGYANLMREHEMSKWVSVKDRLPPCEFELCETGEYVSNVVMVHSDNTFVFNMGFGHVNEERVWTVYEGEHDFMNVGMVTHWQPLPAPPEATE